MNLSKTINSFKYAFAGFAHIWRDHQNMRFHIFAAIGAVLLAYILEISYIEYLIVLITIFFVIICEMMNTAIEEMTDLITKEHRKEAKIAKDVAAASVFVSAIFSIIVGLIIFVPRIIDLVIN